MVPRNGCAKVAAIFVGIETSLQVIFFQVHDYVQTGMTPTPATLIIGSFSNDNEYDYDYEIYACRNRSHSPSNVLSDPVYTRAKVSGFVKMSGFLVFQVCGV